MTETKAESAREDALNGEHLSVYSDNVALPEVRTGKVDVEGDFARDQANQSFDREGGVSFDTVAVPEYHTGNAAAQQGKPLSEKGAESPTAERKHRNPFADLGRTLMNGSAEK